MIKAVTVSTDHRCAVIGMDSHDSLKPLQAAVGGYIECVSFDGFDLWLNEEGKMIGLPVNAIATEMFHETFGPYDILVGDIVLTGPSDEDGYPTSLTDEQVGLIEAECVLRRRTEEAATKI